MATSIVLLIVTITMGINLYQDYMNQTELPLETQKCIHIVGATPDTPTKLAITEPPTKPPTVIETTLATDSPTVPETEVVIIEDADIISDNDSNNMYQYEDTELLAKLIYTESGSCGEYCQWLVGSTIMNLADLYGGLQNIAYDSTKFDSYTINKLNSCVPSDLSIKVANRILSGDRDTVPMAFRMGYYHNFGMPYTNIDNVYFSTF